MNTSSQCSPSAYLRIPPTVTGPWGGGTTSNLRGKVLETAVGSVIPGDVIYADCQGGHMGPSYQQCIVYMSQVMHFKGKVPCPFPLPARIYTVSASCLPEEGAGSLVAFAGGPGPCKLMQLARVGVQSEKEGFTAGLIAGAGRRVSPAGKEEGKKGNPQRNRSTGSELEAGRIEPSVGLLPDVTFCHLCSELLVQPSSI